MIMIINLSILIMSVTSIIMMITNIMAKKNIEDREKNSPFECGFDPFTSARIPFSLRFFLIAMIFLIFDVEIALILPMPILFSHSNILTWSITSILFLIILIIGLFHEWSEGSLNWIT
nr:NADH dehydrogenase subunit 3 [Haania vitalisi]